MVAMALNEPLGGRQLGHVDLSDIPSGEMYAGQRLRRLREASLWSLEALAEKVGVALSTLRFWETEPGRLKKRRHEGFVKEIAKVIDTTDNRIWIGDNGDPAPTVHESDLDEELTVFLARVAKRNDIPADVRAGSKVLLSRLLDAN